MTTDRLERLQRWYRSHCDGIWEHQHGVRLDTLDNPGWMLTIDLAGTPLDGVAFPERVVHRSDNDWVVCRVQEQTFDAKGGPENLTEMVDVLLRFSETVSR